MNWMPVVAFVIGVVARIVLPYLVSYLQDQRPFDARYLIAQVIAAFIALVGMWAFNIDAALAELTGATIPLAFVMGWFVSDVGREAQKFIGGAASFER